MSRAMLSGPSCIFADIEAQPPLMRAEVSQRYLGEEIDWLLTFTNGRELDAGRAWLTFDFDPRSIKVIVAEVGLAEYPHLRTMRAGELLRIRGTIRKINALSIELEITALQLAQTVEAIH